MTCQKCSIWWWIENLKQLHRHLCDENFEIESVAFKWQNQTNINYTDWNARIIPDRNTAQTRWFCCLFFFVSFLYLSKMFGHFSFINIELWEMIYRYFSMLLRVYCVGLMMEWRDAANYCAHGLHPFVTNRPLFQSISSINMVEIFLGASVHIRNITKL